MIRDAKRLKRSSGRKHLIARSKGQKFKYSDRLSRSSSKNSEYHLNRPNQLIIKVIKQAKMDTFC